MPVTTSFVASAIRRLSCLYNALHLFSSLQSVHTAVVEVRETFQLPLNVLLISLRCVVSGFSLLRELNALNRA